MLLILSLVAAVFTTCSFIPQAVKTIKTKDTSGLSLGMYIMSTFGVFLWLIYGIFMHDIAIAGANGITVIFTSIILIYKIKSVNKK